jgi:Xaa-Pro dipeptidase
MSNKFLGGPGYDSYQVPIELFQYNRQKLVTRLQEYFFCSQCSENEINNKVNNKDKNNDNNKTDVCKIKRYIIVLKGGVSSTRYDTDHEPIFRQESYFWWLTGVKEPDCSIVITVDIDRDGDNGDNGDNGDINEQAMINHSKNNTVTSRTTLFVPCLPADYATIMGKIRTCDEWKEMYGVDEVLFCNKLESTVLYRAMFDKIEIPAQILLMSGLNTDSGIMYDTEKTISNDNGKPVLDLSILLSLYNKEKQFLIDDSSFPHLMINTTNDLKKFLINYKILFPILAECRVIKSKMEIQLMEHVTQITSFAHVYVMRNLIKAAASATGGLYEYQCESLFKHYIYYNYGSRLLAYTAICGCGPNSAILHYGHVGEPNSKFINVNQNDHCLFDMVSYIF